MHPNPMMSAPATGQIHLFCQRGRMGFWDKFSITSWVADMLYAPSVIDLLFGADRQRSSPTYTADGIVSRTPLFPRWGMNVITVHSGDRTIAVWCDTKFKQEPLQLRVRVLPGQIVPVYYHAPGRGKRPATLGFAPI